MYYRQGQKNTTIKDMTLSSKPSGPNKNQVRNRCPNPQKKNLETIQGLSLTLSIMMKKPVAAPISETLTWTRKK
jgi:hypothetical protein